MLYDHTEAQRQMLREHAEQLTREMRRTRTRQLRMSAEIAGQEES
jgi:hypothetical protein